MKTEGTIIMKPHIRTLALSGATGALAAWLVTALGGPMPSAHLAQQLGLGSGYLLAAILGYGRDGCAAGLVDPLQQEHRLRRRQAEEGRCPPLRRTADQAKKKAPLQCSGAFFVYR